MTVELPELTPSSVTELGFGMQVVPVGAPLQVKPMGWLKPAMGVSVVVIELLLPRAMVIEVWEFEMVKSGPDPESAIVCGLFEALSVKLKVPFAWP